MKFLLTYLLLAITIGSSNAQLTQISGTIEKKDQIADTIILITWDKLIDYRMRYLTKHTVYKCPLTNGKFVLKIPELDHPTYFSLGLNSERFNGVLSEILSMYLMESGDDVIVNLTYSHIENKVKPGDGSFEENRYSATFFGVGSPKYNLAYILKSETSPTAFLNTVDYNLEPGINGYIEASMIHWDKIKEQAVRKSHPYRANVNKHVLKLLDYDLRSKVEWNKLYTYYRSIWYADSTAIKEYDKVYDLYCKPIYFDTSDSTVWESPYLVNYLNYKLLNDLIRQKSKSSYGGVYNFLKYNYTGELRDRLTLSNYFAGSGVDYFSNPKGERIVADMLNTVSNFDLKQILQEQVSNLVLGQPIKLFTMPDAKGKYVSITDFKGKVVFIDLWYSGCSNCAAYYKNVLSKVEEKYKDHPDVKFITVSIDGAKDLWLKGLRGGTYTGKHATNLYTDGQGSQHPFIKHYNITGYPSPFLVDKDGILIQRGTPLHSTDGLVKEIEEALKKPKKQKS